jgi:hypothetical protein
MATKAQMKRSFTTDIMNASNAFKTYQSLVIEYDLPVLDFKVFANLFGKCQKTIKATKVRPEQRILDVDKFIDVLTGYQYVTTWNILIEHQEMLDREKMEDKKETVK